jgi:hypothetical protein
VKQKKARDHKPPKKHGLGLSGIKLIGRTLFLCQNERLRKKERKKERKEMTMAMAMTRFFYNNSSFVLFSHPID